MFKVKEVTFDIPGEKFDHIRSLFLSKEEHLAAAKEAVAEDPEGWKKRMKERFAAINTDSLIKDPVLQQRVLDLLQLRSLEDASVTGYYEEKSANQIVVNLAVRAKAPSLAFRLLFEDNITALIQVRAERHGPASTVTVRYVGRQVLGVIGCVVVIVAFGACILPGFVCLYLINHINSTWSSMTEAVGQALQESYTGA